MSSEPGAPKAKIDNELLKAAKDGEGDGIKKLLAAQADIEVTDAKGDTPLILAARACKIEAVQILLDSKANVNKRGRGSDTALLAAAIASKQEVGYEPIIKALVEAKADTLETGSWAKPAFEIYGSPPLWVSGSSRNFITDFESGIHTYIDKQCNEALYTPLMLAVISLDNTVPKLLEYKADHAATNIFGETALDLAISSIERVNWADRHLRIIDTLLGKITDPAARAKKINALLLRAAICGHSKHVINYLLENKADIETAGPREMTPLILAAQAGNISAVEILLEAKANIKAKETRYHDTALLLAAWTGNHKVVQKLITAKADVNETNIYGHTPLIVASWLSFTKDSRGVPDFNHYKLTIESLLKSKTKIAAEDRQGNTALSIAEKNGNTEIIKILSSALEKHKQLTFLKAIVLGPKAPSKTFSAAPSVSSRSMFDQRLMHIVLNYGKKSTVFNEELLSIAETGNLKKFPFEELLIGNIKTEVTDEEKYTPLHLAADGGHLKIVQALITANANIEAVNKFDLTPLHLAAKRGHIEIVRELLAGKADVKAADRHLDTPLHWAIKSQYSPETVQVLIAARANLEAVNDRKETPLQTAVNRQNAYIASILIHAKAIPNFEFNNKEHHEFFISAINSKQFELVKSCVKAKADINKISIMGATPLMEAARYNHIEALKLLLEFRADVFQKQYGSDALARAVSDEARELLKAEIARRQTSAPPTQPVAMDSPIHSTRTGAERHKQEPTSEVVQATDQLTSLRSSTW